MDIASPKTRPNPLSKNSQLNQALEVPDAREAFADWLGIPGKRPRHPVRTWEPAFEITATLYR